MIRLHEKCQLYISFSPNMKLASFRTDRCFFGKTGKPHEMRYLPFIYLFICSENCINEQHTSKYTKYNTILSRTARPCGVFLIII